MELYLNEELWPELRGILFDNPSVLFLLKLRVIVVHVLNPYVDTDSCNLRQRKKNSMHFEMLLLVLLQFYKTFKTNYFWGWCV